MAQMDTEVIVYYGICINTKVQNLEIFGFVFTLFLFSMARLDQKYLMKQFQNYETGG